MNARETLTAPSRAVAYLRVSGDEQRERATIETQRVEIAAYVEKHSLLTPQTACYADDGFSGRRLHLWQRPAGERLLADVQTQGIQVVVVYRSDRLGRGRKLLAAIDILEEVGIRHIHSVSEQVFDLKNPNDVFVLTMLAGVSGYESEGFLKRSSDAANRLAREGQWLGGIVPFGYHVEGLKRAARLAISNDPLPDKIMLDGVLLSEAEVVRRIFHWCADEGWPCQRIAEELNRLGVPTSYARDSRLVRWGAQRSISAPAGGFWRVGQIARILHNETYQGVHRYGKRSNNPEGRAQIERAVPAIVDGETWRRAQDVLRDNRIFSHKNAKHSYLLRGLIVCGVCGHSYCGTTPPHSPPYYRCTAAVQYRGALGDVHKRCSNKPIRSDLLEAAISNDIMNMIEHPENFLARLTESLRDSTKQADALRDSLAGLRLTFAQKQAERDSMLTLYRRGRIDSAALDRQLDLIAVEEGELRGQIAEAERQLHALHQSEQTLDATGEMLHELRSQLDQLRALEAQQTTQQSRGECREALAEESEDDAPKASLADQIFALKRRWVEMFVKRIEVNPVVGPDGKITGTDAAIVYRFGAPAPQPSERAGLVAANRRSARARRL